MINFPQRNWTDYGGEVNLTHDQESFEDVFHDCSTC